MKAFVLANITIQNGKIKVLIINTLLVAHPKTLMLLSFLLCLYKFKSAKEKTAIRNYLYGKCYQIYQCVYNMYVGYRLLVVTKSYYKTDSQSVNLLQCNVQFFTLYSLYDSVNSHRDHFLFIGVFFSISNIYYINYFKAYKTQSRNSKLSTSNCLAI